VAPDTTYYAIGVLGCSADSKNVQFIVYACNDDGTATVGDPLTKEQLTALGITDENIKVTSAGIELGTKYGDGETGTVYYGTTAKQYTFTDSAVAIFDGYQYDGNASGGFTSLYGTDAGFVKVHLEGGLFTGAVTVEIDGIDGLEFISGTYTVAAATSND
jgi:hypothetical protein